MINFPKPQAELNLTLDRDSVTIGQDFAIFLFFKTKTRDISSFDAVVSYDPDALRIDNIKTSDVFPEYTRKLVEDFKSRFIVTGVQTNLNSQLKVSNGELAEVTVTALRPGKTSLEFIVDGQKFTNMADSKLQNIPLKTNVLNLNIKEQ